MKTVFKLLASLATVSAIAMGAAWAADDTTPQTWTPGWRHQQMIKAFQDGTAVPGGGPGPGFGRGFGPGMMMRAGWGPGQGGPMAGAIGPDGKIDPAKLPEFCPYRQGQTK